MRLLGEHPCCSSVGEDVREDQRDPRGIPSDRDDAGPYRPIVGQAEGPAGQLRTALGSDLVDPLGDGLCQQHIDRSRGQDLLERSTVGGHDDPAPQRLVSLDQLPEALQDLGAPAPGRNRNGHGHVEVVVLFSHPPGVVPQQPLPPHKGAGRSCGGREVDHGGRTRPGGGVLERVAIAVTSVPRTHLHMGVERLLGQVTHGGPRVVQVQQRLVAVAPEATVPRQPAGDVLVLAAPALEALVEAADVVVRVAA